MDPSRENGLDSPNMTTVRWSILIADSKQSLANLSFINKIILFSEFNSIFFIID